MSQDGERVKGRMQEIAQHIDSRMPSGWGFVVLCFRYGPVGELHYVASTKRRLDIVQAFREWIQITSEGFAIHAADEESYIRNAFALWWEEQKTRAGQVLPPTAEIAYDAFVAGMEFSTSRKEK